MCTNTGAPAQRDLCTCIFLLAWGWANLIVMLNKCAIKAAL